MGSLRVDIRTIVLWILVILHAMIEEDQRCLVHDTTSIEQCLYNSSPISTYLSSLSCAFCAEDGPANSKSSQSSMLLLRLLTAFSSLGLESSYLCCVFIG